MEKLKEKQNRKKEKKQNGTKEQPAVQQTPKATPITEGCPVRIKGQSSVGEVLEINGKQPVPLLWYGWCSRYVHLILATTAPPPLLPDG